MGTVCKRAFPGRDSGQVAISTDDNISRPGQKINDGFMILIRIDAHGTAGPEICQSRRPAAWVLSPSDGEYGMVPQTSINLTGAERCWLAFNRRSRWWWFLCSPIEIRQCGEMLAGSWRPPKTAFPFPGKDECRRAFFDRVWR